MARQRQGLAGRGNPQGHEDLPGIQPTFTQPIEMRISEMLTGARGSGDQAVRA
jgi:Cu/Ag efflux pump CusA